MVARGGRASYRLKASWRGTGAAQERGFSVERRYEFEAGRAWRDGALWVVEAGARVRVCVTVVCAGARRGVWVEDAVPAGWEVSEVWGEGHCEVYPERVCWGASRLEAGVHVYVYEARAKTPGRFMTPGATAHQVDAPSVCGRSSRWVVEVRA